MNENAFSGRVKSVQNRSLSGNRFGTLICALVAAYISDTAPFLASFPGAFVCHPNFGYPPGNGSPSIRRNMLPKNHLVRCPSASSSLLALDFPVATCPPDSLPPR